VKIRVLYFAVARELAGVHEEEIVIDEPASIADARRVIAARHPSLASTDVRLRVARNEAFADEHEALAEGDVLAIIPPVAGG
jgi:molybdopterin converting factor subunit 1